MSGAVARSARRSPRRAGLALAAALLLAACGRTPPERVVLISIDTLRADHLGCYGAPFPASPHLDAAAQAGVRFATAISPAPLTLPSHTSLLTALDPPRHGVRNNSTFALDASVPTLAERLRAQGFATAAFLGAAVLDRQYGLARGFDHYDDTMSLRRHVGEIGIAERRADQVVDAALAWLEGAPDRFLLWVHLYDPHASYQPPPRFQKAWAASPYAGEIAFADEQVGRLLGALDARWPADGTLLVVTSDHGESLGEHGEPSHAYTLYDATQRVPLLLRGAGLPAGRVVETPVRLVDVAPTVLALAGAPPLARTDGADLSPLIEGREGEGRTAYLETLATQIDLGWSPLLGLRTADRKYVRAPRPELYDLRADPGELRDLAAERPDEVAALDALLEARLAGSGAAVRRVAPDAEERARLEALGYVVARETDGDELGRVGGLDPKDGLPDLQKMAEALGLLEGGRAEDALAALEGVRGGGTELELMRADVALRAGDAAAAARYARRAAEASPGFGHAWVALGEALERSGELDEAALAFERAAEIDEASAVPWVGLGRLAEARGDRARAGDLYARAAACRVPAAEALWRRAALLVEAGRAEEADEILSALPAREQRRAEAAVRLAQAEASAGRPEAATRRLEQALREARGPDERDEIERALRALGEG